MSPMSEVLRGILSRLYPHVPYDAAVAFRPMLDLSKGDISTSIPIHVARYTREAAPAVAEKIVRELPFIPNAQWKVEPQGYIILQRAPLRLLCEEAQGLQQAATKEGRTPHSITCLLPDVTIPLYARLRMVGCVAFQALCSVASGVPVQLRFSPGRGAVVNTVPGVVTEVREIVSYLLQHPYDTWLDRAVSGVGVTAPLTGTVWTAHHYYDRFSPDVKSALGGARVARQIFLRMPPDRWLLARERGLSELLSLNSLVTVTGQLASDEQWLRWIFHAASSIPSGDYDPSVALYDELASPRWGLQSLLSRYDKVSGRTVSGCSSTVPLLDVTEEVLEQYHRLLLRSVFVPYWFSVASGEDGEALEAMAVLQELLKEGHAFLNAPSVRVLLEKGPRDEDLDQIVAGLGFALSSILAAVAYQG